MVTAVAVGSPCYHQSVVFLVTWAIARAAGDAPVAETGLGLVAYPEDVVELNGSASSDVETDPLTYVWTQSGGPPVELADPDTANPSFTVPEAGTFRFTLVVNDGTADSPPDEVAVVVPRRAVDEVAAGCASSGSGALSAGWFALAACLIYARRARF